jgi:hypothetical protein
MVPPSWTVVSTGLDEAWKQVGQSDSVSIEFGSYVHAVSVAVV